MDDVLGVKVAGRHAREGSEGCELVRSRARVGGALLHALGRLPGHVDAPHGVKLGLGDVQVAVQAAALAPLRDDGEVGPGHVAHEQQDVDVAGLPEGGRRRGAGSETETPPRSDPPWWRRSPQHLHLVLEGLQLLRRGLGDLEDLHRHVPVPLALEDGPEGARTDPLLDGHLPGVDLPVVAGVPVPAAVLKQKAPAPVRPRPLR